MTLDELIALLTEARKNDPDAGGYDVYFMHGVRTYKVTRLMFDPQDDVDITLGGKWINPQ